MKIIELQFKNINSLKGVHSISFEKVPLSNVSIFAIVGPTGSGKSTILDVITLALFNHIPRFGKITKNEISKEASVLTHHTKEAFASITYEIKGQRYRSTWTIKMNRNDKLNDYEMTFYNPDGSLEDLKKSEVPAKNEEIIGLKYDQFVKAILLSQGEFAKFLKADKNERGTLLENLTGTSIYRKIGAKTYLKYKTVKETLDTEKLLLKENTALEAEQRKELETSLQSAIHEKASLDKELKTLNQLLNVKTDKNRIKESLVRKTQELSEITKETEAFKDNQSRLSIHHKLSHLQGPLATYSDALKNSELSRENLVTYQEELKLSQSKLETAISEMSTLTQQNVDATNFKTVMSAFEAEIINFDNELKNLKAKGSETRDRVNIQKKSSAMTLSDNPAEALNTLQDREKALHKIIENSEIDATLPLSKLKQQQAKNQEELDGLRKLESLVKSIENLKEKIQIENKKLKEFEELVNRNTPLYEKTQTIINTVNEQILLLRKQKEDALKIAELEDLRASLQTDEACPLCGSLDHPYTKHLPPQQQSEIDQKTKQAEHNLEKHQVELADYSSKIAQSKKAIEITQQSIEQDKKQISTETQLCEVKMSEMAVQFELNSKSITDIISKSSNQLKNNAKAIEAKVEIEFNKRLSNDYKELASTVAQYKTLHKKRQEKYKGEQITTETNKLQDDFQSSHANITKLKAVISKETESLKRDVELFESITKELKPKITQLGFNELSEITTNLLDESTLDALTKTQEKIKAATIKVNTEIDSLNKDLATCELNDNNKELPLLALQEKIDVQTKIAEQHNEKAITNQALLKRDDEDRIKLKDREKVIAKLNKEYSKWSLLNKMIGDAKGNTFANFAQGLTLQNLLVYANRRLNKLTDRYLLDKPEDDGSLIVVDKYQGNSSRSVKTLSGGETFIISLALALSLSDMASKNVALDCLFIDEGFGTLDADTLELAISTLETLQSESQKTVGVISHVQALKDRIEVQIKLKKNAQGYSSIEIVN